MARVTVGQLRQIIREELTRSELNEVFGLGKKDFGKALDEVMADLFKVTRKIEDIHHLAPKGQARAIVAGLYSDLFNKLAEFHKYVYQLKSIDKKIKSSV